MDIIKKIKGLILKKQINRDKLIGIEYWIRGVNFNSNTLLLKNEKYPKISIIMPSYNQAQYIERSILSVLNQNYPNVELIIIDGQSTDNSVDIIKKYEPYIAYWVSEKDKGQSEALNKGFKIATGDIIGWINSDDVYLPNCFYVLANYYKEKPNKKVFFGDAITINEKDIPISPIVVHPFNLKMLLYFGYVAVTQSFFWKKDICNKIKIDETLDTNMDFDLYLQINKIEPIQNWQYIPYSFGGFRIQPTQKTGSTIEQSTIDMNYIYTKYNYFLKKKNFNINKYFYILKRKLYVLRKLS